MFKAGMIKWRKGPGCNNSRVTQSLGFQWLNFSSTEAAGGMQYKRHTGVMMTTPWAVEEMQGGADYMPNWQSKIKRFKIFDLFLYTRPTGETEGEKASLEKHTNIFTVARGNFSPHKHWCSRGVCAATPQ